MTKLIVAGSREITDREAIRWAIEDADLCFGPIDEIVHGGARGVDTIAGEIAESKGYDVRVFEAEWEKYDKAAGPRRNHEMAEYGDALVAIWDGESRGTKIMIQKAVAYGLDVIVKQVEPGFDVEPS